MDGSDPKKTAKPRVVECGGFDSGWENTIALMIVCLVLWLAFFSGFMTGRQSMTMSATTTKEASDNSPRRPTGWPNVPPDSVIWPEAATALEATKPLLTAKVGGSENATTLKLSDVPDDHPPQRLIYMQIGKKVIVPQWFTLGLDAQKIPVKNLKEAWEKRTPGVYRIDYSDPVVRDVIFKGLEVEVAQ